MFLDQIDVFIVWASTSGLFLNQKSYTVSELVGLNIDDVQLTQLQCRVIGKGSKERIAFFTPLAAQWLEDYLSHVRPLGTAE